MGIYFSTSSPKFILFCFHTTVFFTLISINFPLLFFSNKNTDNSSNGRSDNRSLHLHCTCYVPSTVVTTLPLLSQSSQSFQVVSIIIPVSQMRKVMKKHVQNDGFFSVSRDYISSFFLFFGNFKLEFIF